MVWWLLGAPRRFHSLGIGEYVGCPGSSVQWGRGSGSGSAHPPSFHPRSGAKGALDTPGYVTQTHGTWCDKGLQPQGMCAGHIMRAGMGEGQGTRDTKRDDRGYAGIPMFQGPCIGGGNRGAGFDGKNQSNP